MRIRALRASRGCTMWCSMLLAGLIISSCWSTHSHLLAQTSTAPDEGIQSRPSRVVLLRGGRIVVSPDRQIDAGDLLIRDGKITEVAANIQASVGAEVIDCKGKVLYPAFIDPMVEIAVPHQSRPDDHWNAQIMPQRAAAASLPNDDKLAGQYRRAGFGALLVAPSDGILKGTSAIVSTAKLPAARTILKPQSFQHLTLVLGRGERGGYPNSPMGVVALARQTFSDAQWYQQAQQAFRADPSLPAPDKNLALEALAPLVRGEQTVIVDSGNELYAVRGDRLAREFNLRAIIRGSGREYRRLDSIVETGRAFIVPVDFPKPPEVSTLDAAASASLQALMHWQLAPENPARLDAAGVNFVITASGLSSPNDLLEQLRKAIARGLSEQSALSALTNRTARLLEIDHLVGTLERGKLANIIVATGSLWDKKSTIAETWVQGERYEFQERNPLDPSGRWNLKLTSAEGKPATLELQLEAMTDKPKGQIALPGELEKVKATASKGEGKSGESAKPEAKKDSKSPSDNQASDKPEKPIELKKPDSDNPPKDDSVNVVPTPPAATKETIPEPAKQTGDAKGDAKATDGQATEKKSAEKKSEDKKSEDKKSEDQKPAEPAAKVAELKPLTYSDYRIEAMFDAKKLDASLTGSGRLSLTVLTSGEGTHTMIGRVLWPDGQVSEITAEAAKSDTDKKSDDSKDSKSDGAKAGDAKAGENKNANQVAAAKKPEAAVCEVNYPLGAFGVTKAPEQPEWLLVRDATIWTADTAGTLTESDLLIHRGIIDKVGKDLAAPEGAVIIDAKGKHVSPGIIDCHSHMATDGGVNESGQAITAEVRIADFIDPNDMTIYYQLAGGVTTANILHGSANPIGGQNQVIKLRWGATDDVMKMREAPAGIKFALGENVKQSNWGDRASNRYPQSRMGVEQIMRDRFEAAKLYRAAQAGASAATKSLPPRRDYELEAIAEILERKRWVHCHSYRQDEILAFLRVLEDYGVTVGSLQHILEGYKVAEAMAKHGATGSTFSDWWAYKMEVIDAIPYNGALMHRAGIIVSFNSDDDELARHLNHEAAKAIKYGGVTPDEALKFVTLNPAKQLRIDQYVGSLAPGKQADFVIWSSSPLSTLSRCEQTWIDGRKYFDIEQDKAERSKVETLRRTLVQKVMDSGEKGSGDGRDRRDPSLWFVRYDEFCNHSGHDHDEHGHEQHDQAGHEDAVLEHAQQERAASALRAAGKQ